MIELIQFLINFGKIILMFAVIFLIHFKAAI